MMSDLKYDQMLRRWRMEASRERFAIKVFRSSSISSSSVYSQRELLDD